MEPSRSTPTAGRARGGAVRVRSRAVAAAAFLRSAPRASGVQPALRLAACAAWIAADGVRFALRGALATPDRREALRDARRTRAVARAVRTLGALKGAYVKAGQFAAARHDVLPPALIRELATLRDRVPPLPFAAVRAALEAELGAPLEGRFAEFDPHPIGAASLAQVHRARLPGGEPVAVKVQYPWLRASLRADLAILRALVALWCRLGRRRLDRRRFLDEFAAGLREELDFEREAAVAREIAHNLADDEQIAVPRVFPSHSTGRVLTMSFVPAVRITDAARLAELGVPAREVLRVVARAYAVQVFGDGLFHADPHPGNLFVIEEPGAGQRPRVLFVDFGLSRRLDPALRREMRLAIHALLRRDLDGFVAGMERMDMIAPGARDGVRRAVGSMMQRLASEGGPLAIDGARVLPLKEAAVTLLHETDGLQLPNDLLLYARTLAYVFALGRELDPDVDLLKLSLPYLLRFLGEREAPIGTAGGPGGG